MSDETPQPFVAITPKAEERVGWTVRLDQEDERLPVTSDDPEYKREWWAIDVAFLAAYATRVSDDDKRYEQVMWAIEQHAAQGNLLNGPLETGLWPILLPDGSTEFAYVVNFWNVEDLRKEQARIEYEDRCTDYTRPHDPDAGRWAGSRRHDEWGRKITGIAESFPG